MINFSIQCINVSRYFTRRNVKRLCAFAINEQQLPLECVVRIIIPTDSRSESEDSEKESHVESTTTIPTGIKRKRKAGNMAVHDVRITVRCGTAL